MSRRVVVLMAAAACTGWLPFLWRPLSPDEGGFLIVASQWGPGSSLYGDYWVDRPPVLIGLFALADGVGDPWALRRARAASPWWPRSCSPALVGRLAAPGDPDRPGPGRRDRGGLHRDAALRRQRRQQRAAGPAVHPGRARRDRRRVVGAAATGRGRRSPCLAGVAGTLAVLTKQSQLDVFVVALVLAAASPGAPCCSLGVALGALFTLLWAVQVSASLGTSAGDLFDALVTFRREAAEVIAESATGTTPRRLAGMLGALVASAAPFVAVGLLVRLRGPATYGVRDLRWPAVALLGWELVVVLLGGSYWLHYLMGLVPGLVLLAAAAAQRRLEAGPTLVLPYAAALVSTVAAIGYVVAVPIDRPEAPVIDYLQAESSPGDTAIVAFGGANILRETGMTSPYEHLWSLPVRVRDPELAELTAVLAGDRAPDLGHRQRRLARHLGGRRRARRTRSSRDRYQLAANAGTFAIFRLAG